MCVRMELWHYLYSDTWFAYFFMFSLWPRLLIVHNFDVGDELSEKHAGSAWQTMSYFARISADKAVEVVFARE